jgi:hypothetical protein
VAPEDAHELLVPGVEDERVELEQDVLLQGVDVLDVLYELSLQPLFAGHVSSLWWRVLLWRAFVVPDPYHTKSPGKSG